MFSCCTCCSSQSQTFNPLDNSFLDPESRLESLRRESACYEAAYMVSCVALMAISVGVVFYVAALGAPLWGIIATGALELLAIKLIFEYTLSGLGNYATQVSETYLYEKEITQLTETIKKEAAESSDKRAYYTKKAAFFGSRTDQASLYTHIEHLYKEESDDPALDHLVPMIARAQKCHSVALGLLREIDITFHKVPEGSKENPYREHITKLEEESRRPADVINRIRQKVRSFEAIHALKWKQYLENRFKEIFALYVFENPVHSGEISQVGYFPTDTPLVDYLLESTDKTRNILFAFQPHYREFTRDQFEEKHKEAFLVAIDAAVTQMHDNPPQDAHFTISSIEGARESLDENAEKVPDHVRVSLANLINDIASQFTWSDPNMTAEEVHAFAERHYEKLFCDPRMQEAICPIVNRYYIDQLRMYDLTSLRGRIAKALLTESEVALEDDLSALKASAKSVDLDENLFTHARKEACKRIVPNPQKTSIRNILETQEFQTLIDEIEEEYLSLN